MKLKKWQIALIVFVVIGVAGAAMGGGSSEPAGSDTPTEEQQEEKKEFAQGETVTFKDVAYTVTKVKKSNGTDFDKPKSGKEFVIVTIKIENKSDEKISYNPFDFKMINSDGAEETQTISIVDTDTALSSGDLAKGGKVEGTIVFEQPKDDKGLKFNYYDNSLFDDEPSFSITIK